MTIVGCHQDTPQGLVIAVESAPQSLDPRFGVDATSTRLFDLLHVALTRADARGRRVPELADRWQQEAPTMVRFHLRDDFHFADGTPVSAADVRATYEALLDPSVGSPRRGPLTVLSGVEAPDPRTVVFHLRQPFAAALDLSGVPILPAGRTRSQGEETIGAGPFRLESTRLGDRIVLLPNPGWPGPPPRLTSLTVRVIPDEVVRVLEIERGNVHLAEEAFEPELRRRLASTPGLVVRETPGTSFVYLALSTRDARLAQRRVRQAISLVLARDRLIRYVLGGAARPATGMLSPEHWAHAPIPAVPHDLERARRLLDRAGLPGPVGTSAPRFRIVFKTSSQLGRRRLAEAIQGALATVGIGVDIRSYEWGTLYADVRAGNFQMATLAWVGVGDPDLYFLAFHSTMTPPAGYNRGYYANAVMDRLLTRGRTTLDEPARRRLYARVQRRLAHDLPVIPLWWEDRVVVQSARLHGFEPEPSGDLHGLAQAWFE